MLQLKSQVSNMGMLYQDCLSKRPIHKGAWAIHLVLSWIPIYGSFVLSLWCFHMCKTEIIPTVSQPSHTMIFKEQLRIFMGGCHGLPYTQGVTSDACNPNYVWHQTRLLPLTIVVCLVCLCVMFLLQHPFVCVVFVFALTRRHDNTFNIIVACCFVSLLMEVAFVYMLA